MKLDYKRLDSIKIRNANESVDLHDVVKTLLVRLLRRKHKNRNKCIIYTEFAQEEPNSHYPDIEIWLFEKYNKGPNRIVYEIQEKVDKKWRDKMNERFKDCVWIEVPLKKVLSNWGDRLLNNLAVNKKINPIEDLRIVLEEYII
jgi:hypothetical protein